MGYNRRYFDRCCNGNFALRIICRSSDVLSQAQIQGEDGINREGVPAQRFGMICDRQTVVQI